MSFKKAIKYIVCVVAAVLLSSHEGKAQRMALSADMLQWAVVSPNIGFEIALSQHDALGFSASVSPFELSKRLSVRHLSISPEYKHWFRMPFYGHYAGADLLYSSYEISGSRCQRAGNLMAVRANYGYSFIIGRKWNIVPHAGIGIGVDLGETASFVPLLVKLGVNIQLMVK